MFSSSWDTPHWTGLLQKQPQHHRGVHRGFRGNQLHPEGGVWRFLLWDSGEQLPGYRGAAPALHKLQTEHHVCQFWGEEPALVLHPRQDRYERHVPNTLTHSQHVCFHHEQHFHEWQIMKGNGKKLGFHPLSLQTLHIISSLLQLCRKSEMQPRCCSRSTIAYLTPPAITVCHFTAHCPAVSYLQSTQEGNSIPHLSLYYSQNMKSKTMRTGFSPFPKEIWM